MSRQRSGSGIGMFFKEEAGGISIFLSIAMLAVTILTGLLVDIARIGAAQNQADRALDIGAISVLARPRSHGAINAKKETYIP